VKNKVQLIITEAVSEGYWCWEREKLNPQLVFSG